MKKRLVAVLIVVVMCLAALSGCSLMKGLERDVQVILKNDGEYVGTYTVNQFNNAVVPEMEKENYQFRGWSPLEDWTEEDGEEYLSESTGLIRYDDVKDFVDGENLSITLYAAYAPVPERDLVIAWYDKYSTSGINQAWMDQFQTNLYAFLTTEGYTPESMDIVIRGYQGDVGTTCSEIRKDGDVDIMYGWSSTSNLVNTGGMVEGVDFIENNGGVETETKTRYAARLSDKELVNLVYNWIIGRDETPDIDPNPDPEPTPDPDPDTQTQLTVGWYAKSGTSGLDQTIIDTFTAGLNAYLETQGYTSANLTVVFRAYDGKVDEVISAVDTDGDVDIMVGMKAFDYEGVLEVQEDVPMGEKTDRRVHLLDDDAVSLLVFDWLKTDEARALFAATATTALAA